MDRWDFDYFEFERVAGTQSLVIMVVHVIRLNGLEDSLGLNLGNVVRLASKLQLTLLAMTHSTDSTAPTPLTLPTLPTYSYLLLPTPTYAYLLLPTLTHSFTYQVRFISKLETGYKSRDDVPFHNRSHAADVVQGTAYFLNQAPLTTSNP